MPVKPALALNINTHSKRIQVRSRARSICSQGPDTTRLLNSDFFDFVSHLDDCSAVCTDGSSEVVVRQLFRSETMRRHFSLTKPVSTRRQDGQGLISESATMRLSKRQPQDDNILVTVLVFTFDGYNPHVYINLVFLSEQEDSTQCSPAIKCLLWPERLGYM